jgi:cytochrome c peroxidase
MRLTAILSKTVALALATMLACGPAEEPAPEEGMPTPDSVRSQALMLFGILSPVAENPKNPVTEAKVELGRMLYYDTRLSKNHDVACNSCHQLDRFGVDNEATSPGHRGARGDRNSPTVYNAAFHMAQFWDGRAADVEEQAKGPVTNPVEMAMPDEAAVDALLRSIPGYEPLFNAAFPGDESPVSFDNAALAIAAFERRLVTPSPFDAFLRGKDDALTDEEVAGLDKFIATGCPTCHAGPTLGGQMFQKLGAYHPYETDHPGRYNVTENEADRGLFKVPSLRNIAEPGPYSHDGSIGTLEEAIQKMAWHQLGWELSEADVATLATFLESLTGKIDATYVARPQLPQSGPDTPAADPSPAG